MRPSTLLVLLGTVGTSLAGLVPKHADVDTVAQWGETSDTRSLPEAHHALPKRDNPKKKTTTGKSATAKSSTGKSTTDKSATGSSDVGKDVDGKPVAHSGAKDPAGKYKTCTEASCEGKIDTKPMSIGKGDDGKYDIAPIPKPPTEAQKKTAKKVDSVPGKPIAGTGEKGKSTTKNGASSKKGGSTAKKGKSSTKKTTTAKTTKRSDLVFSESFAPENFTITDDVSPSRLHARDLGKRNNFGIGIVEGHVGFAASGQDIYTAGLISCTSLLAIDRHGRKVMAHIYPAERDSEGATGSWLTQYRRFRNMVDNELSGHDIHFYASLPSNSHGYFPGSAIAAQGSIDMIYNDWLSSRVRRDNNRLFVATRLPDKPIHYLVDRNGMYYTVQDRVQAILRTVSGQAHFGGSWWQRTIDTRGQSLPWVSIPHDLSPTHTHSDFVEHRN